MPFSNQGWDTTTQARFGSTTFSNVRLGDENLIIQGLPIRKIGQNTGITTGVITGTNATVTPTPVDGGTGFQKTNTIMFTGLTGGGDSGGPVYYDGGGDNLWLIGIHFAGTGAEGWACRITEVMSTLNITPITNGSMYNTTDLPGNNIRIDSINLDFPGETLEVPSTINGKTVTAIGDSAFRDQTNLQKITIPITTTMIGSYAFANCTSLGLGGYQMYLPLSVTSIGSFAFSGCTGLTNINIPEGVGNIGNGVFAGCTNLATLTVSGSNVYRSINNCIIEITTDTLVAGCKNSIIPNYIKFIKDYAFNGCTGLIIIAIPSSVRSIGSYVFAGCSGLDNIVVDSSNNYYRSDGYCLIEKATNKLIICWKSGTTYVPTFMLYIENEYENGYSIVFYMLIEELNYSQGYYSLYDPSFNDEVNGYLIDEFYGYCIMTGYQYGGAIVGFTTAGQLINWYTSMPAEGTSITIAIQPYFV